MSQDSFFFDAPLVADPVSQLPPPPPPRKESDHDEILSKLADVLPELPDDVDLDAPLLAIGLSPYTLTGWHRARAMEALLASGFQAYTESRGENGRLKLRYRRLPPFMPCPGYAGVDCGKPTRGGVLCAEHAKWEEEDLEMGQA